MRPLAALFAASLVATTGDARAQAKLEWDPAWPRFRTSEYVATTALLGAATAMTFLVPEGGPSWRGEAPFDGSVRRALRDPDEDDRTTAAKISDVAYYGGLAFPLVIDAGVTALAVRRSPDVAWQMAWIDLEAFALSGFLFRATERIVGRARPYVAECLDNGGTMELCNAGAGTSFPSGHLSAAVTGAALVCVHHANLELFGHPAADALACAVAIGGAVTVGFGRVVSDNHYFSDNLLAVGIGVASGWLVPTLLHYSKVDARSPLARLRPFGVRDAMGLAIAL